MSSLPTTAHDEGSQEQIAPELTTTSNLRLSGKLDEKIQVFLGGSCNPTTWRQSIAIPFLKLNGISYYNPQVDNWTPDIVDIERNAKKNADWLLFVIDKQTRSTVSLIESAFMAGAGKRLALVIYPFDYSIDHLSIRSGLKQTSNVVEMHEEMTSTSMARHIASSVTLQSTSSSRSSTSSRSMTTSSSNFASGTIRVNGESISSGEFHELRQARYILQSLVVIQDIPIFSDIPQALKFVTDRIAILDQSEKVCEDRISKHFSTTQDHSFGHILTSKSEYHPHISLKDVYLSLDDNDGDLNLKSTVIPILEEKGLTFDYKPLSCITRLSGHDKSAISDIGVSDSTQTISDPDLKHSSYECGQTTKQNSRLALESELSAISRSRVILFLITNKCRGLSIMVLASHFMALYRRNVVLCIQYLDESCCIDGELLSKNAIADYNRGRVYLGDYAVETQVPVFGTIREAVDCCSQRCGHNRNTIK